MDKETITGAIAVIVILVCLLLLLTIIIKRLINRIKSSASKKTARNKTRKKNKLVQVRKLKNKERKAKIPNGIDIPDINEYEEYTALLKPRNEPEMDDDDEDTVPMFSEEIGPQIELVSDTSGEVYRAVCADQIAIGRKSECDIQIYGDKSVSGVHCFIRRMGDAGFVIIDNNSSNGTYLNEKAVTNEQELVGGDSLEIGRTRYTVYISH